MAEPSADLVHVPTERADVDSTGITQRPRKHADGKKLWMKNPQGIFEYQVKVVSAIYSTANHRWEYTLNDVNNEPIDGTTKEKDLKCEETTAGVLPQIPNPLPHDHAKTAAKSESQRSQTEEALGPNLHHVEHRSPSTLIRGCITVFTNLKLHCRSLYARHNVLEASVPAGKTRIRWTCRCGKSLYDDFEELRPGAARELEIALNHPFQQTPTSEYQPTRRHHDPIQPSDEASSGNVAVSSGQAILSARSRPDSARESGPDESTFNVPGDSENKWLLVCARARQRPISLTHVNVVSMGSDYELLTELRRSYAELKKSWYYKLSMRSVRTIKYIQFELHPYDLVDVRKAPDMPPVARKDEYQFQPCDLIPPVGETFLTHLFENPHEANTKAIILSRSPKKRKQRLAVCPQMGTNIGWGLYLVEGWAITKLWLLAVTIFLFSSLVFAVTWSVLGHDVQGGFGVATYFVALATLVLGTFQAHIM